MKALSVLIAALTVTAVSTTFAQEVGYEGLNLGMTVAQVQNLVDSTEWRYLFRPENLGTTTDGYLILQYPNGICSDDLDCYQPSDITVDVFQSRIWQIRIGSEYFTDSTGADSLSGYYQAAYSTFKNLLDAPNNVVFLPSQLSEEQKRIVSTNEVHHATLVQWDVTPSFIRTGLPITGNTEMKVIPEIQIRYQHYKAPAHYTQIIICIKDKAILEKKMKGLDFPR